MCIRDRKVKANNTLRRRRLIAQSSWATARVAEGLIEGEGHGDCAGRNIAGSDCLDKEAHSLRQAFAAMQPGWRRRIPGVHEASIRMSG